jgi:hypothetical protein
MIATLVKQRQPFPSNHLQPNTDTKIVAYMLLGLKAKMNHLPFQPAPTPETNSYAVE